MFHSPYLLVPDRISHRMHWRTTLYMHTHFLSEETEFIAKDGVYQDLRAGNRFLIIQFIYSYWMPRDGPKFQRNRFFSEHATRMKLKQFVLHAWVKKIGSSAGYIKKWKLDSYPESPARGPIWKWFQAVGYIRYTKLLPAAGSPSSPTTE